MIIFIFQKLSVELTSLRNINIIRAYKMIDRTIYKEIIKTIKNKVVTVISGARQVKRRRKRDS